jgi:hypothetical protein
MSEIKVNSIKGVAASTAALTINNTDGTCTANITSVNDGQLGNRRININGGFQVFQRSTSAASVGSSEGYFAPDRYRQAGTGSMRYTASKSTDVPAGYGFSNSLKYDCTTASGTVSAGHFVAIEHRIEGQDLQVFCKGTAQAKQYTLSFHVKSPKTGIHVVELYDNDNNRHVAKSYTISSADTWQKVTLTFPADTTGAFGNDTGSSLRIFFWLMAGTDYAGSTLPSAWASFSSTARATGQVNVFDSTSNDFFITGIQLEVGSVATDFEHKSFGDELNRCFRYYEQFNSNGLTETHFASGYFENDTTAKFCLLYTRKRAAPTITASAASTFTSLNTGSIPAATNFAIHKQTERAAEVRLTVPTISGADGQSCILISVSSTEATIKIDSEL